MTIRIKKVEDRKKVKEIQDAIKENDGYCCCALVKESDTKCMCKSFLKKVEEGYIGECDCGLYQSY